MLHRTVNVNSRLWIFLIIVLLVIVATFFEFKLVKFDENYKVLEATVARLQISNKNLENSIIERGLLKKESTDRNIILVYNRVPKTASTSFVNVAYDLCKRNSFNVLHVNVSGNSHFLSFSDQARFVYNVTHWDARKPGLYHGHFAYVNFEKFGSSVTPHYINLLRQPLDRLVSYYYFLRYGDNYRPHLLRRKHGDTTFDDCVKKKQPDCEASNMWLQIPFLCGHSPFCWEVGNPQALEEAKRNLVSRYLLVGLTEQLEDFIALLEAALPTFFRGATQHFKSSKKTHLRKTTTKIDPAPETVAIIKRSVVWQMENELYQFALAQFNFAKKRMDLGQDGWLVDRGRQFMYEKISPK